MYFIYLTLHGNIPKQYFRQSSGAAGAVGAVGAGGEAEPEPEQEQVVNRAIIGRWSADVGH